jgi:hypothetical protein
MSDKTERSSRTMSPDRKLDLAIHRLYCTYGPNLSLFFKSVCAQAKADTKRLAVKTDSRFLKAR